MKRTNQIFYELSEDEQEAIRTIYNFLDEIYYDASEDDIFQIDKDDTHCYEYKELQLVYEGLQDLLKADFLILTKKDSEEEGDTE